MLVLFYFMMIIMYAIEIMGDNFSGIISNSDYSYKIQHQLPLYQLTINYVQANFIDT